MAPAFGKDEQISASAHAVMTENTEVTIQVANAVERPPSCRARSIPTCVKTNAIASKRHAYWRQRWRISHVWHGTDSNEAKCTRHDPIANAPGELLLVAHGGEDDLIELTVTDGGRLRGVNVLLHAEVPATEPVPRAKPPDTIGGTDAAKCVYYTQEAKMLT